jgi:hypothetical protein
MVCVWYRLEWLSTSTSRIRDEGAAGPELLRRNGLDASFHQHNVNNRCCLDPGWIAPNGQFLEAASNGDGHAVDVFLGGLERRWSGAKAHTVHALPLHAVLFSLTIAALCVCVEGTGRAARATLCAQPSPGTVRPDAT